MQVPQYVLRSVQCVHYTDIEVAAGAHGLEYRRGAPAVVGTTHTVSEDESEVVPHTITQCSVVGWDFVNWQTERTMCVLIWHGMLMSR